MDLPVLKTTEMITVRDLGGRSVFTMADIAEGLQVEPARVRNQFSRNVDAWSHEETDVYHFGTREQRWFTARGAMRFCRYVKSGRSDALFNHLLDIWEAERSQPLAPMSETDRLARITGEAVQALTVGVVEVRQLAAIAQTSATEAQATATEALAVAKCAGQDAFLLLKEENRKRAKLRAALKDEVDKLVEEAIKRGFYDDRRRDAYQSVNRDVRDRFGVRAELTSDMLSLAIAHVQERYDKLTNPNRIAYEMDGE